MNSVPIDKRVRPSLIETTLLLLGLVGLFVAQAQAAPNDAGATILRLGSDIWPPFTDAPGKQRVAIDLVHTALERSRIKADSTLVDDFGVLMQEIRVGTKWDGSAAVWRTDEREAFLLFSRPYLENRLVLLARQGTDVSAKSLAALIGKRVGIVESYEYGETVSAAKGPILVRGPSEQANLERLVAGELDYILLDELLVYELFERQGQKAEQLLVAGEAAMVERPLHFAVRRDLPNAASIIERFDNEIQKMIAEGAYNRLLGVAWVRVDLDGDGQSELVLGGVQAGSTPPESAYEIKGAAAAAAGSGEAAGYVVDGKAYDKWSQIPERYKVPVERNYEGPEPTLVLIEF